MSTPHPPLGTDAGGLDRENPWPGLEAFWERDAGFFRGRDAEIGRLSALIRRALLTVVYGRSGLGKSSLLQAGVFPRLRPDRFLPVYVRLRHEEGSPPLVDQLAQALAAAAAKDEEIEAPPTLPGETLWEHLHRAGSAYWSLDNRPIIPVFVLDQFEEVFTHGRRPERRDETEAFFEDLADLAEGTTPRKLAARFDVFAFLEALADLPEGTPLAELAKRFENPVLPGDLAEAAAGEATSAELRARLGPDAADPDDFDLHDHRYKLVLAIREDFLADLKSLRPRVPSLFQNDMRLGPMSGQAGLLVTQAGGEALVPREVGELVVRLVGAADEGAALEDVVVDPALLSLFLRGLNERRREEGRAAITPDWVRGEGEGSLTSFRDNILTEFYDKSVGDLEPEVRAFVEDRLLTRGGHRNSFDLGDALLEQGITDSAVETLVARRLVRIDDSGGAPRLELAHDVLAGVVRQSRDERVEREEARRRVAEAAARAEKEREEARRQQEKAELAALRAEQELRRIEQEEELVRVEQRRLREKARASRRLGYLALSLGVSFLVAMVLAVLALAAQRSAVAARESAVLARRSAEARLDALERMLVAKTAEERDSLYQHFAQAGGYTRRLSAQDSLRAELVERARALVADTLPDAVLPATARDTLGLKLWTVGAALRIGFIGGTPEQRALVRRFAPEWTRYANLRFEFCDTCTATDIRVGFAEGQGSWSYLGTDALGIPHDDPTINLDPLMLRTSEAEARRVVLHDFGHVLGLLEEHMNPNADIPWDREAAYRYYRRVFGWPPVVVDNQLLTKATGIEYRPFDPRSIMMFPVDSALTGGRFAVGTNPTLSASDRAFAARLYPGQVGGGPPPDTARERGPPAGATGDTAVSRAGTPAGPASTTEEDGMFGSNILEVAIGLALIYLLLSLIASAVREAVEGFVKSRAADLERGIRDLLDDPEGKGLARALYQHPQVYGLYSGAYTSAKRRFGGGNLPTYIPARNFAVALLDMARRGPDVGPYAAQQTSPELTVESLRASVQRIPSTYVQRALLSAIDTAQGDVTRVQRNLEAWYDSAMDRVSGVYKRRTQFWLFVIGLGVTLALNVNTLTIADYLARDDRARMALVQSAQGVLQDSVYRRLVSDTVVSRVAARAVYEDLQSLNLPIGWDRRLPTPADAGVMYWLRQVFGLLLTAVAVMLGAPFWFDVLNKFVVIRSTVKPHEKSPEESSEDRQTKGRDRDEDRGAAGGAGAPPPAPAAAAGVPAAAPAAQEVEPPHEDHEWEEGDPQEGIL